MLTDLRPKRLAKHTSDVFDTHKYIFKKFQINDKKFTVCCINNTPFIKKKHILETFKIFKKNKFRRIVMLAKKLIKKILILDKHSTGTVFSIQSSRKFL